MPEEATPFPFPDDYGTKLTNKLLAKSIRDYIGMFERGRAIRTNGKLADVDIQEIMRLAEDLGRVDVTETDVIRALVAQHPDYFRDDAQREELERFCRVHIVMDAIRLDPVVADILDAAPIHFYRRSEAIDWMLKAQALATEIRHNEDFYDEHGTFDPDRLDRLERVAHELGEIIDDDAIFSLSDADDAGLRARKSFFRDMKNLLLFLGSGETDHESEFADGRWVNWNRDIEVFPERYLSPADRAEASDVVERHRPVRFAGGGHTFNISPSMGGSAETPAGTLVTLDRYRLEGGVQWKRVAEAEALAQYHLSADESKRVVRASAGIRLRDFGAAMWDEGMALPVAGSTDAQSLGGLVATDLHSTGHTAGFLSQQLLEVVALDSAGRPIRFVKNEAVPRGAPGRFTVHFADGSDRETTSLPSSGAIGLCGAVVEVVVKLDPAFNFEKSQRFVPRTWVESNIEKLLDPASHGELFDYDHVSFYYPGGAGPTPTVRMNTWKRTDKAVEEGVETVKVIREAFDHVGSALSPDTLLGLCRRQAAVPGAPKRPDDDELLAIFNARRPLVLPANKAFARKLFFQHDEIEIGLPLSRGGAPIDYDVFREALADSQALLKDEEYRTIIEVRFTPDSSEGMLGPGTGGATCYLELATPLGQYSRRRVAHIHHLFEEHMRREYRGRPHLGKKTSAGFDDMEDIYGATWAEFLELRSKIDPTDTFLPGDNELLRRLFSR